jgi:hypothetical protein
MGGAMRDAVSAPGGVSRGGPQLRRWARITWRWLAFAAATAFTARAGFYRFFTLFAPWDDEGYLLIALRAFVRGGRLYDDVYTQYGPFYFELMGGLFALLGLQVSHDAGRLVSLAVYALAALLCGLAVAFASRSALAGVIVQLLVFRVFWPSMAFEPMHPGGLACLLLAGALATSLLWPHGPVRRGALTGALVAALLLVKINVGAFAALAVAIAAIPGLVASGRRWAPPLLAAVAALLPFALMAAHLDQPWTLAYAWVAALASLGVVVTLSLERDAAPRPDTYFAGLAAGASATAAVIALVILARGTSPAALVEAVLIAPRRQASALTLPPSVPRFAIAFAVLAFLASVLAAWRARRTRSAGSEHAALAPALARLGVAAALVTSASGALEPRVPAGFWLAGLAWCAARRPRGVVDPPVLAALRRFAPALAALQVLHAYPVAGSQLAWSSFLLVPVGCLCALDGSRQAVASDGWRRAFAWERARAGRLAAARRWLVAGGGALLLGAVTASFAAPLANARRAHDRLPSLALPGAELLHVPARRVRTLHRLVDRLRTQCETFVTLPGLNSLYLWAELEPPTGFNATSWMFLFDAPLQERIVARLETIERLCLVRQPQQERAWARGRPLPVRPLSTYLETRFAPHETVGEYELWLRRVDEPRSRGAQ